MRNSQFRFHIHLSVIYAASKRIIQFNSKTLIIPQGAILLWSWRAHQKYKVKRTIQQTKESYFNRTIVINIKQLWLHHKIVMKLRSHTCKNKSSNSTLKRLPILTEQFNIENLKIVSNSINTENCKFLAILHILLVQFNTEASAHR